MTPGRHVPATLVVVLVLLLLVAAGACIVLLAPGRERPADVEPTPVMIILPTATREAAPTMITTPSPIPEPTEALPRSTSTRLLTLEPTPTSTPTAEPTKRPMTEKVERG